MYLILENIPNWTERQKENGKARGKLGGSNDILGLPKATENSEAVDVKLYLDGSVYEYSLVYSEKGHNPIRGIFHECGKNTRSGSTIMKEARIRQLDDPAKVVSDRSSSS